MTGKILRNSYLVAISALLASALLFFGVMYRDYEDEAFARLRAETSAIAQGLRTQGASYFDGFEPDDRVTWVDASGSVLYDSAAPADQLSNDTGREEIARAMSEGQIPQFGHPGTLGQYFAALTNMRSVGVMGDFRTYDYAIALRAVTASDFMTAEAAHLPWDLIDRVTTRIVNEVDHVNRVVYDCTGKPPGTIEFE